jgi:hypothetical protein
MKPFGARTPPCHFDPPDNDPKIDVESFAPPRFVLLKHLTIFDQLDDSHWTPEQGAGWLTPCIRDPSSAYLRLLIFWTEVLIGRERQNLVKLQKR